MFRDTSHIRCRGCQESNQTNPDKWVQIQYDHYGIETGYWCGDCYESDKYPYRRDAYYDYFEAGEYMNDDY